GLHEPQTLTYISPQLEQILGYQPDEFIGKGPDELLTGVHPKDRGSLVESADQGPQTTGQQPVEFRVQAADGRWVRYQDPTSIVRHASCRPELWQGVLVDITARKSAEAALRRAEARFRAFFEGSPEAILVADEEGSYVDANPAALALLGYAREEL